MIVLAVVAGLSLFGGGVATGVALGGKRRAEERSALESLMAEQHAEIVATVSRPAEIDADTRALLAQTPPACVEKLGGDAMSAQCALLQCWATGSSTAQRPDCDQVEAAAMRAWGIEP